MDSAKYVAKLDSLCTEDLSEARGGSDLFMAGPGYRIVSLAVSHGLRTSDASLRVETAEDVQALKDRLAQEMHHRWGEQRPTWGMVTLRVRAERGEEIPEPWATMSILVEELDLWQPVGTERWIALGVADKDDADEVHVLAVASDTDPP
ncbi:hypothetical protein ACFWWT_23435 [Streptomyces sp. NPDC058676]|uniref:hypothetical protein n=1 Tax=unclassified Streptomyces TaxID=2593676 RepID=UPI0036616BC0